MALAPGFPSSRLLFGALLALVVVATAVGVQAARGELAGRLTVAARHEEWMAKFGRVYADAEEKARRQEVFGANARYVDAVNRAGNRTYTLGLNKFSDLTDDEFAKTHLGYRGHPGGLRPEEEENVSKVAALGYGQDMPDSVDWRAQGAVTGVKDQRSCGCCWAFAAVAATEGLVKIATGNLISMSEQQVLDCTGQSPGSRANTCISGYVDDALRYVAASRGLQTEAAYAYTGMQGACQTSGVTPNSAAAVGEPQTVSLQGDEGRLQGLVAVQPIAVGVEALDDFRHYKTGVFRAGTSSCGQRLNHAVTVVGYGSTADGKDYWLVKNQWGTSWGDGGYMRIARGNGAPNCGISTYAYYPTMDS